MAKAFSKPTLHQSQFFGLPLVQPPLCACLSHCSSSVPSITVPLPWGFPLILPLTPKFACPLSQGWPFHFLVWNPSSLSSGLSFFPLLQPPTFLAHCLHTWAGRWGVAGVVLLIHGQSCVWNQPNPQPAPGSGVASAPPHPCACHQNASDRGSFLNSRTHSLPESMSQ